jgi:hypothetical protein
MAVNLGSWARKGKRRATVRGWMVIIGREHSRNAKFKAIVKSVTSSEILQ